VSVIRAHVEGREPEAFAPKHRWAMDWYYPVLVGALRPQVASNRLDGDHERLVLRDGDGSVLGVRCVADQPWVTAAETCECALAYLRIGDRRRALELFASTAALREAGSGHYFTGRVYPDGIWFPDNERSTYTGAAVVLCADALTSASPASRLFVDDGAVPAPLLADDPADEPVE
jgi:hypothetical protein